MYFTLFIKILMTQLEDKIVEQKQCRKSGTAFTITESNDIFYEKISPIFA